jgi:hypothetical protein
MFQLTAMGLKNRTGFQGDKLVFMATPQKLYQVTLSSDHVIVLPGHGSILINPIISNSLPIRTDA